MIAKFLWVHGNRAIAYVLALLGVHGIVMLHPALAFAEPTFPKPIESLVREPVSLFDWGMEHSRTVAEKAAEKLKKDQAPGQRLAAFSAMNIEFAWADWDTGFNGLLFGIRLDTRGTDTIPTDGQCDRLIDSFQRELFTEGGIELPVPDPIWNQYGYRTADKALLDKVTHDSAVRWFAVHFSHYDYRTDLPSGIPEFLADHSQIRLRVYKYVTDYNKDVLLECSRPFAGRVTTVTKALK